MGRFRTAFKYLSVAQWARFYISYDSLATSLRTLSLARDSVSVFVHQLRDEMAKVEAHYQREVEELAALRRLAALNENKLHQRLEAVFQLADLLDKARFARQNAEAVEHIVERHDLKVEGDHAASMVRSLQFGFMAHEDTLAAKQWAVKQYARHFCNNNRQQAAREIGSEERRQGDAMGWLGFFGGATVVLLAALVMQLATMDLTTTALWPYAHLVFRFHFIAALFLFGIALDVLVWSRVPVNWAFIFGVDRGRHLEARHYALIAAQLSTLSLGVANLMCFTLSPDGDSRASFASKYWLLALFLLHIAYLVNPFPFAHRASRWWLIKTMTRIVCAPLSGKVEFRDFWLADQFCSLVTPLVDLAFIVCFFTSDCWTEASPSVCLARLVVYRPIVAALPYWWRTMQCARRYYDYRFTRDLLNMAKYGSSIGVIMFAGLYTGLESGHWGPFKTVWIVLAVLSTGFGWIWDVFMDWSVGRPQWALLRRNLMLPKWVYYLAMPLDLLLRCAWLFTVAPAPFDGDLYIIALAFSLAVVELLRRIGWNVLRLANEHTQNALQLKVLGDDLLGGDTYETEHRERAPHVDDSVLAGAAALSFVKMRNAAMAGSNTVTTDEERETSQLLINGDH